MRAFTIGFMLVALCFACTKPNSKHQPTLTNQPKYKVGECYDLAPDPYLENWETQRHEVIKIVKVGKEKYLTANMDETCEYLRNNNLEGAALCSFSYLFSSVERRYSVKVNCPS